MTIVQSCFIQIATFAKDGDHLEQDLGNRVKAIRTEQGLSQKELSEKAGVSMGTLRAVERSEKSPRPVPTAPRTVFRLTWPFVPYCTSAMIFTSTYFKRGGPVRFLLINFPTKIRPGQVIVRAVFVSFLFRFRSSGIVQVGEQFSLFPVNDLF